MSHTVFSLSGTDQNHPPVPLIDLVDQYDSIRQEVSEAVQRVFETQQFVLGEEVAEFEGELAAFCDARHAVGCASGTDALILALNALDVGAGAEVITSPYTFFATASAIVRAGARPVFVDIDPETFNLDPDAVESAITERTRAIMPVHLFGRCANMEPLWRLSVRHGLAIVEDAAQAIGATYRGRHAGVLGTLGCFSFFPTKNLGGAGDGGMITTDDADLAARLRRLRVHGDAGRYEHLDVGMNSRLDALQAAVLRVKLRRLDAWTEARRENAARYRELLDSEQIADHVELPADSEEGRHVYNQFCIRVREGHRDAVLAGLRDRNIGSAIYYPKPLHLQHCFRELGYLPGAFPESERASSETIALPIYAELGESRQRQVVTALGEAVREATRRAWTIPIREAGKRAA